MRVLFGHPYLLHAVDEDAYRQYHRLPATSMNLLELRVHIRDQLNAIGVKGVDAQVKEGRRLRHDATAGWDTP